MHLSLHPIGTDQENEIRRLFSMPAFERLVQCIRAEYEHELYTIKDEGLVDLVFNPEAVVDKSKLVPAAKLKAALDILEDVRRDGWPFRTLHLES